MHVKCHMMNNALIARRHLQEPSQQFSILKVPHHKSKMERKPCMDTDA